MVVWGGFGGLVFGGIPGYVRKTVFKKHVSSGPKHQTGTHGTLRLNIDVRADLRNVN